MWVSDSAGVVPHQVDVRVPRVGQLRDCVPRPRHNNHATGLHRWPSTSKLTPDERGGCTTARSTGRNCGGRVQQGADRSKACPKSPRRIAALPSNRASAALIHHRVVSCRHNHRRGPIGGHERICGDDIIGPGEPCQSTSDRSIFYRPRRSSTSPPATRFVDTVRAGRQRTFI